MTQIMYFKLNSNWTLDKINQIIKKYFFVSLKILLIKQEKNYIICHYNSFFSYNIPYTNNIKVEINDIENNKGYVEGQKRQLERRITQIGVNLQRQHLFPFFFETLTQPFKVWLMKSIYRLSLRVERDALPELEEADTWACFNTPEEALLFSIFVLAEGAWFTTRASGDDW